MRTSPVSKLRLILLRTEEKEGDVIFAVIADAQDWKTLNEELMLSTNGTAKER